MTDQEIKRCIQETVKETIAELRLSKLLNEDLLTESEKTERILKFYPTLKKADSVEAKKAVKKIEKALMEVQDDYLYEIVPLTFFKGYTREEVAEFLECSERTVSRVKKMLIKKISLIIINDPDVIRIFSNT